MKNLIISFLGGQKVRYVEMFSTLFRAIYIFILFLTLSSYSIDKAILKSLEDIRDDFKNFELISPKGTGKLSPSEIYGTFLNDMKHVTPRIQDGQSIFKKGGEKYYFIFHHKKLLSVTKTIGEKEIYIIRFEYIKGKPQKVFLKNKEFNSRYMLKSKDKNE